MEATAPAVSYPVVQVTAAPTATPTAAPVQQQPQPQQHKEEGRRWKKLNIGNPFPASLPKRCQRAARVVQDLLQGGLDQVIIPDSSVATCKGIAIISLVKAGYIWSGRIGSGVVVSRLPDGTWSAPSAISCAGVGCGAQAGVEFTDLVIFLRDENALNALKQLGNMTFGASGSATLGPWGRSAEISLAATCAMCCAFSQSRGLFGGISLEGLAFLEGSKANRACYGARVTAKEILAGSVPHNDGVAILIQALNQRFPPPPTGLQETHSTKVLDLQTTTDDKAPLIASN